MTSNPLQILDGPEGPSYQDFLNRPEGPSHEEQSVFDPKRKIISRDPALHTCLAEIHR